LGRSIGAPGTELLDQRLAILKLQREVMLSPETSPEVKQDSERGIRLALEHLLQIRFPLDLYAESETSRQQLQDALKMISEAKRNTTNTSGTPGIGRRIRFES